MGHLITARSEMENLEEILDVLGMLEESNFHHSTNFVQNYDKYLIEILTSCLVVNCRGLLLVLFVSRRRMCKGF